MEADPGFPCAIQLLVPFPTSRLASTALQALQVDPELSPLVQRLLSVDEHAQDGEGSTLRVSYQATTNRMLRVAVNSFMDSLRLVIDVMQSLDVDVLRAEGQDGMGRKNVDQAE